MKDISDKVSYLQGLSEGMNISRESPQGKIISGILNVLDEMADEITIMQKDFETYKEYVESIDNDLWELEEILDDYDDDIVEIKCSNCGQYIYLERDFMDEEDIIEVNCPHCNEIIYVNDGSFDYSHADIDDILENKNPEN